MSFFLHQYVPSNMITLMTKPWLPCLMNISCVIILSWKMLRQKQKSSNITTSEVLLIFYDTSDVCKLTALFWTFRYINLLCENQCFFLFYYCYVILEIKSLFKNGKLLCIVTASLAQLTEIWIYCHSPDVHSCPSYLGKFSCTPDATVLDWLHYHDYLVSSVRKQSCLSLAKHTQCQYLPLFHLKQFFLNEAV